MLAALDLTQIDSYSK